jgi:hypothetical protein
VTASDQLHQDCIEELTLYKNNYAALKIIYVGIFLFYFIKISFPVHLLFKWRQNLSARPHVYTHTHIYIYMQYTS